MESTMNVGKMTGAAAPGGDGYAPNGQPLAEMLSPDETVQLLANVVQKMAVNQTHQVISDRNAQYGPVGGNQNPNISMISNEDILKQALQICHQNQHNVTMPPLQMN